MEIYLPSLVRRIYRTHYEHRQLRLGFARARICATARNAVSNAVRRKKITHTLTHWSAYLIGARHVSWFDSIPRVLANTSVISSPRVLLWLFFCFLFSAELLVLFLWLVISLAWTRSHARIPSMCCSHAHTRAQTPTAADWTGSSRAQARRRAHITTRCVRCGRCAWNRHRRRRRNIRTDTR